MPHHGSRNNAKRTSSAEASKRCSSKKQSRKRNSAPPEIPFKELEPLVLANGKCCKFACCTNPADIPNSDTCKIKIARFSKGDAQTILAHEDKQDEIMDAAHITDVHAKMLFCKSTFHGHALRVWDQVCTAEAIALGHANAGNLRNVRRAVRSDIFTPGALR